MRIFQVDAFTRHRFRGNPAAVVPLESWPDDGLLQSIAAENNLAETAFILPEGDRYQIRWLTPTIEVDLCGHATLAAAHVAWTELGHRGDTLELDAPRSGRLGVRKADHARYTLDFPALPPTQIEIDEAVSAALGIRPAEMLQSKWDYIAVYENKRDVPALNPDIRAIKQIDARGIIATAPATSHDFVSRFFAPRSGVDEDHATGSAHCSLAPYWAQRLGRQSLSGHQVSPRGAEIGCTLAGDRVELTGGAVTYMRGEIILDETNNPEP